MSKKRIALLFIFLCSFKSFSQVFSFKTFSEDDGLSQSFIYDICQDSRGFLVIATGDGLSSYGGYNFKVFKTNSGLAEIGISTLYKDSKNKIWLGHFEGGVSYVMPNGRIGKVNFKEPLSAKLIQILESLKIREVFMKLTMISLLALFSTSTTFTTDFKVSAF